MRAGWTVRFWMGPAAGLEASVRSRWSGWLLLGLIHSAWVSGCTSQDAYFCPADGCSDRLINEMNNASKTLHVAIAYFNHDGIADAIIAAHDRGVEVKVLGEADESGEGGINEEVVAKLKAAGVDYRDDGNDALMHNKFSIIDGYVTLTGSFNYTNAADQRNNENLVVLMSEHTAGQYELEFEALWAAGVE